MKNKRVYKVIKIYVKQEVVLFLAFKSGLGWQPMAFISPKVRWIQEGDIIDRDDWKLSLRSVFYYPKNGHRQYINFEKYVKIKCKHCDAWH